MASTAGAGCPASSTQTRQGPQLVPHPAHRAHRAHRAFQPPASTERLSPLIRSLAGRVQEKRRKKVTATATATATVEDNENEKMRIMRMRR